MAVTTIPRARTNIRQQLQIGPVPSTYSQVYFSGLVEFLVDWHRNNSFGIDTGWQIPTNFNLYKGPIANAVITSSISVTAGSQTFTVSAASGTVNGMPWTINVGTPLLVDFNTPAEELVYVTAITGVSVTATFVNSHTAPFNIEVPPDTATAVLYLIDTINSLLQAMINTNTVGGYPTRFGD